MARDLYQRQKQGFVERRDLMVQKIQKMYTLHKEFKDFYVEVWNAYSDEDRHSFLENCRKTLEDACPDPKFKYVSIMGMTCPEFFNDELINGRVKLLDFMNYVMERKENDQSYPWIPIIQPKLITFLEDRGWNIYEDFQSSPKRKQWTEDLCWEQRSMWCAHFALCTVANMCEEYQRAVEQQQAEQQPQGNSESITEVPAQQQQSQPSNENRSPEEYCARCGKSGVKLLRCGRCKKAWYCSQDCQRRAWTTHKTQCQPA
eukprot:TRINITY_DN2218_c0_g1_i1.p1 TRINITY_DN2218_c0_g1~~TRINITY_DN2218_c0_g1_i1.p1  ORF type:complete len:259 (+),score=49.46 TRINITY_DN2218_c0_g1_i1:103-879(+)